MARKRLDVGMGKDETHLGDLPWYPSMDWRGKSTGNFAGGIPFKMVVFPLKMVVFPLKMVISPLKIVIFPLKIVIFHSYVDGHDI